MKCLSSYTISRHQLAGLEFIFCQRERIVFEVPIVSIEQVQSGCATKTFRETVTKNLCER